MSALIVINDINVPFEVVGGEMPTVSSNYVAEVFGKQHANILKTIKKLPKDDFFNQNFILSSKIIKNGLFNKETKFYNLTRDGFSLLVMGFTGEKAYKWKVEFIKAFNLMEAELKRQGVINYVNQISDLNAVLITKSKRHKREIASYKGKLTILKNELSKSKSPQNKLDYTKGEWVFIPDEILANPKFKPFAFGYMSYKELYNEYISVLGNNNTLKIVVKDYKQKLDKEKQIILNLVKIQKELEKNYTAIGAVMSYINNDCYFLENNEILKG